MKKKLVMVVAILFSLLACSSTNKPDLNSGVSELELHDQYSDELRSLMQRMGGLIHERELTAWDIDRIKKRRGEEIIEITTNLIAVTDNLYQNPEAGGFSLDRQLEFSALTQQLAVEAENVARTARVGDSAELVIAHKRMANVCANCHQQFRLQ